MKNADSPAMPSEWCAESGLTKREYFAGQALQGLLANHYVDGSDGYLAESALIYADALLAELGHTAPTS